MVNQFVGKGNPPVLRDNFHEVLFHLFGRGVGGEFQAAGDAEDMGVDDHADGNTVSDAEDDVGGFAGRAGDGEKIFHLLRNFAVEVGNDLPRRTLNRLRLVVVEASGADDLFDLLNWRGGEVLCGGEGLEEDRSDHVDASVGALRRKDRGDEQFPGIAVMESTFDVWVSLPEEIENGFDPLGSEGVFADGGGWLGGGFGRCCFLSGGLNRFRFDWLGRSRFGCRFLRGCLDSGFGGHD